MNTFYSISLGINCTSINIYTKVRSMGQLSSFSKWGLVKHVEQLYVSKITMVFFKLYWELEQRKIFCLSITMGFPCSKLFVSTYI